MCVCVYTNCSFIKKCLTSSTQCIKCFKWFPKHIYIYIYIYITDVQHWLVCPGQGLYLLLFSVVYNLDECQSLSSTRTNANFVVNFHVALPASETALPKLTSNFSFEVCTRNRIKICHRATNFKITKGKISISAQIISFFPLLRHFQTQYCLLGCFRAEKFAPPSVNAMRLATFIIIFLVFFKARLQNCEKRLSVSSCPSVCRSVRMQQLLSHWTDFDEIW